MGGNQRWAGTDGPDVGSIVATLRAAGCVFAEDEARLLIEGAGSAAELAALVAQRVAGQPLEHILGWAEFHGLRIVLEPGVFVPRRRTEYLVDQAAALLRPGATVLDLCCGSGAVGAALAAQVSGATAPAVAASGIRTPESPAAGSKATGSRAPESQAPGRGAPGIELYAVDIDPAAIRSARRNLPAAHVYEGDLYAPLPSTLHGRVDMLVVIAPYVPTASIRLMHPEARDHEPAAALDGGPDGLDVLRRVLAGIGTWLAPGAHLLTETGEDQVDAALAEFARHGLAARNVTSDDGGATVLIARHTG